MQTSYNMRTPSFHRRKSWRRATKNKSLSQEECGFSFQTPPTPSSRLIAWVWELQLSFDPFLAVVLPRQVKNWNFKEHGNCAVLSYLFGDLILQLKSQDPSSMQRLSSANVTLSFLSQPLFIPTRKAVVSNIKIHFHLFEEKWNNLLNFLDQIHYKVDFQEGPGTDHRQSPMFF